MSRFDDVYAAASSDPERFWADAARAIDWAQPWDEVLDASGAPFYRWFPGARLNTCFNAVDRHVLGGRGEQAALIYDSPMTGSQRTLSYAQLQEQVARCAGALRQRGVEAGDRVVIYMPMVPEAVVAMLACARLGAIHSVVFGGFAADELAKRIDDAQPKALITATCGLEPGRVIAYMPLVEAALERSTHGVDFCIVLERPETQAELQAGRDTGWSTALANAALAQCVDVAATDPLYILYTSGTTGMPKGVVRDNGGHAVAMAWSMRHIYGCDIGDVFWAASDIGWVVGHSYIVYAPLIVGCTTVLYEGKPVGTPDAGAFGRVIADHGVKVLFTAPTAIRAIKREDADAAHLRRHDTGSLEALFLAGERCDPDTLAWSADVLGVPVIDHWWQTETGWTVAGMARGIELEPVRPGAAGRPMPGYRVECLDDSGTPVAAGTIGNIAIRLPLPPGTLTTLWRNPQRFIDSYMTRFNGYYVTGDAGYIDDDGYVYVMSRTDDVINVAGHRLSTGGMEEVLAGHRDVAECAVVGMTDALKGQVPLGLVVLKAGVADDPAALNAALVAKVRAELGPVASFKKAVVVQRLPKTRSGKILRATLRRIADGETVETPPTIDDPAILGEIRAALNAAGVLGTPDA